MGACPRPLEVEDGTPWLAATQRLAGAARSLAVGGPAQHEFRRAIERAAQDLERVSGMKRLDERREPGKGRMVRGSDDAGALPQSWSPSVSGWNSLAEPRQPAAGRKICASRPAPRSNALSAPMAWPERRT